MVIIKRPDEIEKIRKSNIIVAEILKELKNIAEPGITTKQLDDHAENMALAKKARPAFKGYHGYPFSLCASVNDVVVHGMPSNRVLVAGDIISLDFGIFYDGFYGDAAITVPVGDVSDEARKLMKCTEDALYQAIKNAVPGNRLGDISASCQERVEQDGYSVVRDYVGHGIGKSLHEDPQVPNYGIKGRGLELKEGMVLSIEPMVNGGTYKVKLLDDGWTVLTEDGSLSAHFEHTVAITRSGPDILSCL
ncbi:MAG: type I methionyl aminopeptidase [Syntrophobacterales bacterium]|jgi:methionyl aminopeptidase|nr:type I methionyl aminopeptidase [Syntrophobacterales bacterium]